MENFIHKSNSFVSAEKFKKEINKKLTPEQKLTDIQICREQYFKLKGLNESRKRLRRVIKIIKQT